MSPTSSRPTNVHLLTAGVLVTLGVLYVISTRPMTPARLHTPVGTAGGVAAHVCDLGFDCVGGGGGGCGVVGGSDRSAGPVLQGYNPSTCPDCRCERSLSTDASPAETAAAAAATAATATATAADAAAGTKSGRTQAQQRDGFKPLLPFPADKDKATGIVVSMVTHDHMDELTTLWWQQTEQHLLAPRGGAKLPFLLFLDWELSADEFVWRAQLPWTRVVGTNNFVSDDGTEIRTRQIAVNFPEWLARNMSMLDEPEWLTCYGPTNHFDVSYQRYTQSKANQILHSDALDGFDFMLWVDTDVQLLKTIPVHNIFADLADRGCTLAFSKLVMDYGCDHTAATALQEYGESIGQTPAGWDKRWCHPPTLHDVIHPWSGFFGVWLGMFRSPQILELTRWMYEWHPSGQAGMAPGGNFMHRWSDQAVWFRLLCMWDSGPSDKFLSQIARAKDLHTPNQPNGTEDGGVCHRFGNWDDVVFRHHAVRGLPRSASEYKKAHGK